MLYNERAGSHSAPWIVQDATAESRLMSDTSRPEARSEDRQPTQSILIGAILGIVLLTAALVVGAVLLAINAESTAPTVEVVRDLLIIALALELLVIGVAIVVFLVQVARFINLVNNEVQPIITATSDTLNTVRGTAAFLGKNLVEPVIAANAALRGMAKAVKDVEAIRKAAGIAVSAAMASTGSTPVTAEEDEVLPKEGPSAPMSSGPRRAH